MTNLMAAVTYFILITITVITLFFAYLKDRTKPVTKYLIHMGLIIAGWQLFAVLYYLAGNEAFALWTYTAKLMFAAFAPIQMLLLCVKFYNAEYSGKTSILFACSYIIPVITAILAITAPFHRLLRAELFFEQVEPLRILHNVRGPWFWIHTSYSYIITIVSTVFILYQHFKLPKGFRLPSVLIAIGSTLVLIGSCLAVFTSFSKIIDLTLVGLSIGVVFTYAGITCSDKSGLLAQAFDKIFAYIEDYIFVLNTKNHIIEMNPSARSWIKSLGFKNEVVSFDEITQKLTMLTGEPVNINISDEQDFQLTIGQKRSHYNLNKQPILDQTGKTIGTFTIFSDITRYKLFIERIEKSAGVDPLTNLGNRRSYEQALEKLDVPACLPFSVILGDVNFLKIINDNMGHAAGDKLLYQIAQILRNACPDGSSAYRIGGDEFVLLLPRISIDGAESIAANIHKTIAQTNEQSPLNISIALGIAAKETMEQNLQKCIALADYNMYLNKENDRRSTL